MKRIYKYIFVIVSISLCVFMPVRVFASDINAAEQSIISYCSGVFTYEGKSYQLTSGALGSLRAELATKDLTSAQASIAISEFSANIGRAIAEGHMVEVGGQEPEESQADPEDSPPTDHTGGQEKAPPKNNEGDGNKDKETPPRQGSTDEKATNSQNEGDTKKVNMNGLLSEAKNNGVEGMVISGSEAGGENVTFDPDSEKANERLLQQSDIYTVAAYQTGSIFVAAKDGTILYEGGMPIKNTGFYISPILKLVAVSAVLLLAITLVTAIIIIKRGRKMGEQYEGEK